MLRVLMIVSGFFTVSLGLLMLRPEVQPQSYTSSYTGATYLATPFEKPALAPEPAPLTPTNIIPVAARATTPASDPATSITFIPAKSPAAAAKTPITTGAFAGMSKAEPNTTATPTPGSLPTTLEYVVKPGDSLGSISRRFYGDKAQYLKIYQANRKTLSSPNSIRAGQKLVIPAL